MGDIIYNGTYVMPVKIQISEQASNTLYHKNGAKPVTELRDDSDSGYP